MSKEELLECITCGNEIAFKYTGKSFSITYSAFDKEDYISFCEYYQEPVNVKSFEELIKIRYKGVGLMEMLESLTENDIWIY